MDQFVTLTRALSAAPRIRILKMLEPGELCVCHLTDALGLAQPTVSRHLHVLQQAGLVRSRKSGQWVHYRLAEGDNAEQVAAMLALVKNSLKDDPLVRRDGRHVLSDCRDCGEE